MWRVVGTEEVYDTMEEAEEAYYMYYADSDYEYVSKVELDLERAGYSLYELASWIVNHDIPYYDENRMLAIFQTQMEQLVPDIEKVDN